MVKRNRMVQPTKKTILFVLVSVLFLHGCSFSSILFSGKTEHHVVVIDYPPNRIAYGGKMNKEEHRLMMEVIDKLERRPYKPHKFSYPLGATLNYDINKNFKHEMKHESKIEIKK